MEYEQVGDAAPGDVGIDLSSGEIGFLCEMLDLTPPPVLGDLPWAGLAADVAAALRDANRDALVARRVLEVDEVGNLVANEAVAGILTIMCEPQLVLHMRREDSQRVRSRFVAALPQLSLEIVALRSDVWRLIPFPTEVLLDRIREFATFSGAPAMATTPATVTASAFDACTEAVQNTDLSAAAAALVEGGADTGTAAGLAAALGDRHSSARIDIVHRPEPGSIGGLELAWFESGAGLWIVEPVDDEAGVVEAMCFQPASDDCIVDRVVMSLPRDLASAIAR